jgi:TRAP-type C4-dicarboxylate transport system permease large subunit
MIMMLNLGIGLCHPPVGAILFVGCAVGKVSIEEVMRKIWPFYAVMFAVLMLVTTSRRYRCGCRRLSCAS